MIPPDRFAAAAASAERRLPRSAAELADLYANYEAEKRRKRWLDFDDLLSGCAHAIETDGSFAAGQRWRFRDLFVDEFQDATPLQMRLLRAWLAGRADLTVEACHQTWLTDHGPLVASFARDLRMARYIQSHTIAPEINQGFVSARGLAAPLDGVTDYYSALYNSPFSTRWFVITFGTDTSLKTGTGWDNVTGVGTPDGVNFVNALVP